MAPGVVPIAVSWPFLAAAYFLHLTATGLVRRAAPGATALAAAGLAGSIALTRAPSSWTLGPVSVVLAPAVLLAGYWAAGRLLTSPSRPVEDRLLLWDHRLFRAIRLDALLTRAPRLLLELLELSYLLVYPMLPAGALVLLLAGAPHGLGAYWSLVIASGFLCYGALPFLQTRPPRHLEAAAAYRGRLVTVRRINLEILGRGSHQANTIPSGHAAVALAAALGVLPHAPAAGLVLLVLALLLAVATVLGRYHFVVDTILGVGVAVLVRLLLGLVIG